MPSIIQRSLAGGIVGPELAGRAEQAKYQTGLKDALNVIVQRYGGVTNRSGMQHLATTKHGDTYPARLIRFVFNADQTYVLELGHLYGRIYRNGAPVGIGYGAWSSVTPYEVGDQIVSGITAYYCILAHTNQAPPNATYWYPIPGVIYEFPTPYDSANLRDIQYVQSGDVVTLVHPSYPPRELRRRAHDKWALTLKSFAPATNRPTSVSATAGGAGANTYRYQVTAYNKSTLEESYPGRETTRAITGATQANPCQITAVAHGYSTGDEVYIEGVGGMTQLNGQTYVITNTGVNTFTLNNVNSTGFTAYTSGGTAARPYARINSAAAPTASAPHTISAANPGEGFGLWFYRWKDGVFEFIGEANGNASAATITFSDTNIAAQSNLTPPVERAMFAAAGSYPSTVTYVQSRMALANTDTQPERIWLSQVDRFSNFTRSIPVQDDDAIEFQLAGRQVNAVRHVLEVGARMVVLTESAEWTINGDNGTVLPDAIEPRQQGYDGAASVSPVIIGNTALYVQARGSFIRDLRYDYESEGYNGRDLTVFCPELFDGYQIVAMDYQKIPHSVVWAVRSDGALLGLTYVRDHDVWGWHRHLTADGTDTVEDVCCVPEGTEDAVYLIVRRRVGAGWSRSVERLAPRQITDLAEDAFFVDGGLTYDGRNTGSTTMTLTGGTLWDESEVLTCTASGNTFAASNVGDQVVFYVQEADAETGELETARYFATITAYTSATVVSVRPDRTFPASIQGAATTAWALAVDTVAGLDHLEGRTVTALCDGCVNPDMVVTGGQVTLSAPSVIVHCGLPYVSRIETLDAENLQGETWMDKKRKVHAVSVRVKDTRGLWMGFGDGQLFEHEDQPAEDLDDPIPLYSGLITENVDTTWEKTGKVVLEQRDPLPMTILAVIPVGSIGGT